jgi:glutathione S-transferase
MSKQEHKAPEYLKIHPHGVVPALVDGEVSLIESSAICMYLADKYPEKRLAPPLNSPARGRYYQWMVYTIATLEPPLVQIFLNTVMYPEEKRSPAAVEEAKAAFAEVAGVLSAALAGRPYLLGAEFSAADVMIGSTLGWAQMMGQLGDQPGLQDYVKRLSERPASQRAAAD